MVFAYYQRLTAAQKRVYRESDKVRVIRLADAQRLHALVEALSQALTQENRREVQAVAARLIAGLAKQLAVPPLKVTVLASRPHDDHAELHGIYYPAEGRKRAHLQVWMRTARYRRVVAFRTFLRTLLHELCHHLDYELLNLADSFHTEGFYQRESSLFHQLVPPPVAK